MMLWGLTASGTAQVLGRGSMIGTIGLGMAIAPEQFYDYWGNGVQLGAEWVFPSTESYALSIAAGYAYFPFDEERFLKRLGITGGTTSVEGAAASIVTAGAGLKYTFPPYEHVIPFVNAGASVAYSYRARSTTHYPYQDASGDSQFKLLLSVNVGAGFTYPLDEELDAVIGVRRYLGLRREKTVNTDFTSFYTGIQWLMP